MINEFCFFKQNIYLCKKYFIMNTNAYYKLLIAAIIFCISGLAYAQKSFGYLSYSEVLKSMPQYKEVQTRLQTLKDEYNKETERAEDNFSKMFAEYIDGQKSFSENIMMKRQKELQQLMEQSIQFKEEAKQLLKNAEKELMEPLENRLKSVIEKVGTDAGYDYILNTDGNNYPFINNAKGENITDKVKALL